MLGQRNACPANVAFHRKFCLARVVSNNAVHNQFVFHVRDLVTSQKSLPTMNRRLYCSTGWPFDPLYFQEFGILNA
jgi:hypothetical protein